MPVITKLKTQTNQNRVNVFLDHKFAFGLTLNEVVKRGFKVGQQLSSTEFEEVLFTTKLEKAYRKSVNFLSYRPRSLKEVDNYLNKIFFKQGLDSDLAEKIKTRVLAKLEQQQLINDQQFACWWLDQRLSFKPKGKKLISLELRQKGVDQEIIDQVLAEVDEKKMAVLAKKIIVKKLNLLKNISGLKLKQKLCSYLLRRGFDYRMSKNLIDELVKK